MKYKTIIEPFRIKSVEPIALSTLEERTCYLKEAHYNSFLLKSEQVIIDMLTDSGTSAMSSDQWAAMMNGDESYAGSRSWTRFEKVVHDLTGMPHILPTHQGRAAEKILYSHLGGKGKLFFSNTHFDTTRANIEFSGAMAVDLPSPEAKDLDSSYPFKGNMDVEALKENIETYGPDRIGGVILTVTNNSGGGQPVSLQNAIDVHRICGKYHIPFIIDCCRIAENSYFIKHFEEAYSELSYHEIARKMLDLADACIMSAKKDGLANIGGFLAMRDDALADACSQVLIITEGFTTYGGLAGRDMEAIAQGLIEVFDPHYLEYRIRSTQYLGNNLHRIGVPVILPIGAHAVYVDAGRVYSHIPPKHYPGQALVCELYRLGGIRSVEIGSVMFGKYDSAGRLIPAPHELVRLAIPRRVYSQSHIDYVIEVFGEVMKTREQIRGMKIIKETRFLRHFTAHFEPAGKTHPEITA